MNKCTNCGSRRLTVTPSGEFKKCRAAWTGIECSFVGFGVVVLAAWALGGDMNTWISGAGTGAALTAVGIAFFEANR